MRAAQRSGFGPAIGQIGFLRRAASHIPDSRYEMPDIETAELEELYSRAQALIACFSETISKELPYSRLPSGLLTGSSVPSR
jgi:hypothetical protein